MIHVHKVTNTCKNRRYKKPWLAEGLLNACKKKNYLYKQFINNKTKMNEIKYKKYENNLVDICKIMKELIRTNYLMKRKMTIKIFFYNK